MKTYTGNFSTDTGTSLIDRVEGNNLRSLKHLLIYLAKESLDFLAKGEYAHDYATIHIWMDGAIVYSARITKGGRVTIYNY